MKMKNLKADHLFLTRVREIGCLNLRASRLREIVEQEEEQPDYIRKRAEKICKVDGLPQNVYYIHRPMEDLNLTFQTEGLDNGEESFLSGPNLSQSSYDVNSSYQSQRTFRDQGQNTDPNIQQEIRSPGSRTPRQNKYKHGVVCNLCGRILHSVLKRHIDVVHLKLKPYSCSVCSKSFGSKSNLQSHVKRGKCTPVLS